MTTDHYPEHVKKVEDLIASGEAGRKVAKEIAEDRKVTFSHRCLYLPPLSGTKIYHLTSNTDIHKYMYIHV